MSITFANLADAQTYCNPIYSGCSSWRVTGVVIPQANFSDTNFPGATCYADRIRTSQIISLNAGINYDIDIKTSGWVACGMAIDFNDDGDFDDPDEVLILSDYIANQEQTYSNSFVVPSTVASGNHRMRIWTRLGNSGDGDSPCGSYSYGIWIDYTANITQNLSTLEVASKTAKVYPNPVSDILNIEDTQTIQSIEIYDFSGKLLIRNSSVNKKDTAIKLSTLVPGVYTAKITNTQGAQIIKFIKK